MAFEGVPDVVRRRMSRIRKTGSKPEVELRRELHIAGYRYRKNLRHLPGTPDIVFPKRRKVIFVHGCFWHQHQECPKGRMPGVRQDYWIPKLERNRSRDVEALAALRESGWAPLVVWECEWRSNRAAVVGKVVHFLDSE
jgi:DNA mismatch endonuclease (patch repair protein)